MAVVDQSRTGDGNAVAAVDRGMQFFAARDYRAAKAELTKAKALQSGDIRALTALAVASDMTGDFRTADKAYDRLMTSSADRAMLFNNMGYSFMLRGELGTAFSYLTEAARLEPDNPVIGNNLLMLRKVTVR